MEINNKFILIGELYEVKDNLILIQVDNNVFQIRIDGDMNNKIQSYKDQIKILGIQGVLDYGERDDIILVASKITFING